MKKILVILVVFLVLLVICGCGSREAEQSSKPTEQITATAKERAPPTDEELKVRVEKAVRYKENGEPREGVYDVFSLINIAEDGKKEIYVDIYDKTLSSKWDIDAYGSPLIDAVGEYVDTIYMSLLTDVIGLDDTVVHKTMVMSCIMPKTVIDAKRNGDITSILSHSQEGDVSIYPSFQ